MTPGLPLPLHLPSHLQVALLAALTLAAACGSDGGASTDTSAETSDSLGAEVTDSTAPDGIDTAEPGDTSAPGELTSPDASDSGDSLDNPDISISETSDSTAPDTTETPDTGDTAAPADTSDADVSPKSCLDEHAVGDRIPRGDHCNFCECKADGELACTDRLCRDERPSCTYDGVTWPFSARFPASDGCNECVCAASGLACTRRCADLPEEGAILVESLDDVCGEDATFTARNVLAELPSADISGPFAYNRGGSLYPETAPDTTGRLRIVFEDGFVVCRIPSPTQPAFDIEVTVEWMTADGAFDEGMHTYLRKNGFGFVDAWYTTAGWAPGALDGAYTSSCLGANGFGFAAQVDRDGTVSATAFKVCEIDIALDIGAMETSVPTE